jgi:flagellar biosynthesis protein FlhG
MDQAQNLRNIIKLQNQTGDHVARVITVTSGKGGVGKSTVSINLAMQFRRMGKSVIIFDADFGLANIEVMIGAIPKFNLSDMIFRGKDIKDIIVKGPEDIGFVSGGSGINGLGNMNRDQVAYLVYKLKELETLADIIIIDTGAGISDSVLEFVSSSAEVILVTTPEPTSITDSYALLKSLNARAGFEKENTKIKVIANRVTGDEDGQNLFNKLNVVVSKFLQLNMEFLGIIPMDDNVPKSVMQQKPITMAYPNSKSTKAFEKLSEKLLNISAKDYNKKKGLAFAVVEMFRNREKNYNK